MTVSWMPYNRTKSQLLHNVHNCVGVTSLHFHATVLFVTYQKSILFGIQTVLTWKEFCLTGPDALQLGEWVSIFGGVCCLRLHGRDLKK
jgi:hypothetical protein